MCQLRQLQVCADEIRFFFRTISLFIFFCIEIHFGIVFAVIGFAIYLRLHIEADILQVAFCVGIRNLYRAGLLAQLQDKLIMLFSISIIRYGYAFVRLLIIYLYRPGTLSDLRNLIRRYGIRDGSVLEITNLGSGNIFVGKALCPCHLHTEQQQGDERYPFLTYFLFVINSFIPFRINFSLVYIVYFHFI